jgi:MFS transporter, PAT family, beta-lactamase induction signal transducer AmpG
MRPLDTSYFHTLKLLTQPRLLVTVLLAFASGLPLTLTSGTLEAWYTVAGVPIIAIGALSLVGQPYVYKFLWAPLLDRYTSPILGRRRGWIFIFQLGIVLSLSTMAFLDPKISPWLLGSVALVVAFCSASQDIVVDAYRVDLLKPEERGLGAAVTVFGYRVALLISGGLALIMADWIGWRNTYLIMAGLMAIEMLVTFLGPEPPIKVHSPTRLSEAIIEPFREFLTRKAAVSILIFIVFYKLADALALSLGTAFLIRGLNFSLTEVGTIYKIVGLVTALLGSFVGGVLMTRLSLYKALLWFGILQGVSNLTFALLAYVGKNYAVMVGAISIDSFCGGLSNVAIVAFLMSLCDIRYTATQFALLSALSAVGRVFTGPLAGIMVTNLGWMYFFLCSAVFVLPGLCILIWLKRRIDFDLPP